MASSICNKHGWREALRRLSERRLAGGHPSAALRRALIVYAVFGISTSGFEQQFSQAAFKLTDRMGSASAASEESCIKVAVDLRREEDEEAIIAAAREVWSKCFGAPRAAYQAPRIDKGTKRNAMDAGVISEVDFIHKRRREASKAAAALPISVQARAARSLTGEIACPAGAWGEGHAKELDFLKGKLLSKKLVATRQETLLPSELNGTLRANASAKLRKQIKAQLARDRKCARDQATMHGSTAAQVLSVIKGEKIWFEPACRDKAIAPALISNSLKCARKWEANVFVTSTPGRPTDESILFASAIRGSHQISPGLLASSQGCSVKIRPLLHLQKTLYISPGHADFSVFAKRVVANTPGCRWRIEEDAWAELRATTKAANLLALVRPCDVETPQFRGYKNLFSSIASLNRRLVNVDTASSLTGI